MSNPFFNICQEVIQEIVVDESVNQFVADNVEISKSNIAE
jgi:hypothetical protein